MNRPFSTFGDTNITFRNLNDNFFIPFPKSANLNSLVLDNYMIATRITTLWKEDFIDEDTGEVVTIERHSHVIPMFTTMKQFRKLVENDGMLIYRMLDALYGQRKATKFVGQTKEKMFETLKEHLTLLPPWYNLHAQLTQTKRDNKSKQYMIDRYNDVHALLPEKMFRFTDNVIHKTFGNLTITHISCKKSNIEMVNCLIEQYDTHVASRLKK